MSPTHTLENPEIVDTQHPWEDMTTEQLVTHQSRWIQEYIQSERYQAVLSDELFREYGVASPESLTHDQLMYGPSEQEQVTIDFRYIRDNIDLTIHDVSLPYIRDGKNLFPTLLFIHEQFQNISASNTSQETDNLRRLYEELQRIYHHLPTFESLISLSNESIALLNASITWLEETNRFQQGKETARKVLLTPFTDDDEKKIYERGAKTEQQARLGNFSLDAKSEPLLINDSLRNLERTVGGAIHLIPRVEGLSTDGMFITTFSRRDKPYQLNEDGKIREAIKAYYTIDDAGVETMETQLAALQSKEEKTKEDIATIKIITQQLNRLPKPGDIVLFTPMKSVFTPIHELAHQSIGGDFQVYDTSWALMSDLVYNLLESKKLEVSGEQKEIVQYYFSTTEIYANVLSVKYMLDVLGIVDVKQEPIGLRHLQELNAIIEGRDDSSVKEDAQSTLGSILYILGASIYDIAREQGKEEDVDKLFNYIAGIETNRSSNGERG